MNESVKGAFPVKFIILGTYIAKFSPIQTYLINL